VCYPESKFISNICNMLWVTSVVHIRVGSNHVSISVSLFRFGRIGIAIAIDNVTKLILGMVLRGYNTLCGGRSLNRSSKGRSSMGLLLSRNCSFNDINVIFVDFNNSRCSSWFRCRFRCNYEAFLAGAEIICVIKILCPFP